MSIVLDGTTGITTPGLTNTGTETIVNLTTTGNTILGDASTDTLNVGNGGLVKDASGNVGIGTTPSAWGNSVKAVQLPYGCAIFNIGAGDVAVTQNAYFDNPNFKYASTTGVGSSAYRQIDGTHRWLYAASGTAGNNITFTEAMRIDSSGNVGIGTSSPSAKLDVNGNIAGGSVNVFGTSTPANGINNVTTNALGFFTNSTERMRIDSSGNLLVGTTTYNGSSNTPGVGVNPVGQIAIERDAGAAAVFNRYTSNGNIVIFRRSGTTVGTIDVTTTATSYVTSSDYRLKENVAPMTGALAKVSLLKPCIYKWKVDGSDGQGFIAHELAEVCPQAVVGEKDATEIQQYEISPAIPATHDEDGNELTPAVEAVMGEREVPKYQGIDTSFLVATLTAAIQELKALVDTQASTITALQADVAALKGTA